MSTCSTYSAASTVPAAADVAPASPLRVRHDPYNPHCSRAVVAKDVKKVQAAVLPNASTTTLAMPAAPGKGSHEGGKTDVGALGAKKLHVFLSAEGQPVGYLPISALTETGLARRDIAVSHGSEVTRLFFGQVGHDADEVTLLGLISLLAPGTVVLAIDQQRRKSVPARKTGAAFVEVVAGTETELLALSRRIRFVNGGILIFADAASQTAIERERTATYQMGMKQFADGNAVHRMVVEPRDRHNGGSGAREPMPQQVTPGLPIMSSAKWQQKQARVPTTVYAPGSLVF